MSYFHVVLLVVICGSTYVAVFTGVHGVPWILPDQYTLVHALVGTYKKLYEHRRGTSICDGALGGV